MPVLSQTRVNGTGEQTSST